MANDENHVGERETDAINSDQHKERTNEDRNTAHEKEVAQGATKTGGRQETQKEDQVFRNDQKKAKRGTRGREEWGGYQGY